MIPLTLLYAPADRPDLVRKAMAGTADVVTIDLEDAVAPSHKLGARDALPDLVGDGSRRVRVRINAMHTPWHDADIEAVAALPASVGMVLPKAERLGDVADILGAVPGRAVHLLIESALGLGAAFDLARTGAASIGLGEADLRADLGCTEAGLAFSRGRVVVAARAAGLPAPVMSVYPNIRDVDGLAASCREGRDMGFRGRSAIHPAQLATIREAFLPTADEISGARDVMARFAEASEKGQGALAMSDGGFVDEAVVRRAREVLQWADEPGQ